MDFGGSVFGVLGAALFLPGCRLFWICLIIMIPRKSRENDPYNPSTRPRSKKDLKKKKLQKKNTNHYLFPKTISKKKLHFSFTVVIKARPSGGPRLAPWTRASP